jgi:cytochrome c556
MLGARIGTGTPRRRRSTYRRLCRRASESPESAGELSPEEIEAKFKADPAMWASHVAKLREVAMESVAAIDKKSADGLLEAGDHLDDACEACHLVYWYPNEQSAGGK